MWEGGGNNGAGGDVTIDGRVTVSDKAYLILKDGCKLTVTGGICATGKKISIGGQIESVETYLTIFGQAAGTGLAA